MPWERGWWHGRKTVHGQSQIGAIMKWTTEKPTKPGWYWDRGRGLRHKMLLLVDEPLRQSMAEGYDPTKLIREHEEGWEEPIEEDSGEWAGPLEPLG